MTELRIPELALVVLVGVSGSGKSYFARRHFTPTQVVSSDRCRGMVADDENDQAATADAFDLLHHIVRTRLRRGLLTVVDATNVQPRSREQLVRLAKEHDVLAVAIVLDVPERVAIERNAGRADRDLPGHVVPRQRRELRRGMRGLSREFKRVYVLRDEQIDTAYVTYEKAWPDRRELTGPFDLIGDVHGCRAELEDLLGALGYAVEHDAFGRPASARHPEGRTAVFLGDLVDRGPDTPGVLCLAMGMVAAGTALCVPGNHENKLVRALKGRKVTVAHGLAESLDQLAAQPEEFRDRALAFMDGLVSHLVLDGGRLVVAHAGLTEAYHGRASGRVRSFALYGETTGETDEYGLPVRYPWANEYRGDAMVVYGHTPVPEPEWVNNTLCVDTGCVFGGRLTALRYPERELVSVPARKVWYEPVRPLVPEPAAAPGARRESGVLRIGDVQEAVETSLMGRINVRAENVWPALEVMSRFAVDPRWLVYLPPTMAPAGTSRRAGLLEHPAEAFAAYRRQGVTRVVCEEKHMGSRAVVVVCRDAATAAARFGVDDGGTGAVYTRTGRSFFTDATLTGELLARVRSAAGFLFDELQTGWLVLDCELMPWSVKAAELVRTQYAAAGAAARAALPMAADALARAAQRGLDVAGLRDRVERRSANAAAFRAAYARYCGPADGLRGLRLAPFQVLAGEGRTHARRDHLWHLEVAGRLAAADPLFAPTAYQVADLAPGASPAATRGAGEAPAGGVPAGAGSGSVDRGSGGAGGRPAAEWTGAGRPAGRPAGSAASEGERPRDGRPAAEPSESERAAVGWWERLTAEGGEGMVVKPLDAVTADPDGDGRRLVQPGLKCRGREYLRIVYGPDYTEPEHLDRLRGRSLGRKRSLAMREYALGLEALDRFVAGEPLWRVHQAVFGVLALESEPVDPRL